MGRIYCVITLFVLVSLQGINSSENGRLQERDVDGQWLRFLIAVEQPWNNCSAAVETNFLDPTHNQSTSPKIKVGHCDEGPLTYKVTKNERGPHTWKVSVSFYTSSFVASPPTCDIMWNGTYLTPQTTDWQEALLPGCFVNESDEGYHPTNFWYYIMEWQ